MPIGTMPIGSGLEEEVSNLDAGQTIMFSEKTPQFEREIAKQTPINTEGASINNRLQLPQINYENLSS